MIKVTKSDDEIIIREIPVMRRIVFFLFTLFAGFLTYSLVTFYLSGKDNSFSSVGGLLVPLLLGLAIYSLLTIAATTTIINRQNRNLTVRKSGLLKNSLETYQFDDIEDGFISVKSTYVKGTYYSIELPLKSGKNIELAAPKMINKNQYNDIAKEANKYLFDDSGAFKLTILNDD